MFSTGYLFEHHIFRLEMPVQPKAVSLKPVSAQDGLFLYEFACSFEQPIAVKGIRLGWSEPMLGIASVWTPMALRERAVHQWWAPTRSEASFYKGAPILAAVTDGWRSAYTVALSDAVTPSCLSFCVNDFAQLEQVDYCAELLTEERTVQEYRVTLRIDQRGLPLAESIGDAAAWWETLYPRALPVNPACELPLYSSWYNFHQHPNAAQLEQELAIAAELGFKAAIIDDGWQYEGNGTGDYRDCGNWAVAPGKFPDFAAFVRKAHDLGIKVMLWFPVPFVGKNTEAYRNFKDCFLYYDKGSRAGVLDPRRPQVRTYLAQLYRDFVQKYGLDGLKLDFIDSFRAVPSSPAFDAAIMDCTTVDEGVTRLLQEITAALRAVREDCMIEFRQHYVGPAITGFCNMLRVLDCAFESVTNRQCHVDLRMLTRGTAVHSDMLFWAHDETPRNCARQLANILFSVPQISAMLTASTPGQLQVIKAYLNYWQANRTLLLRAPLNVQGADGIYSAVSVCDGSKKITALYTDPVALFDGMALDAVNGTAQDILYLDNTSGMDARAAVYGIDGTLLAEKTLAAGVHRLEVPAGGRLEVR